MDGKSLLDTYKIVVPPSQTMHWPVMKLDSSLAKNTTRLAMSIGKPIRPKGIVLMICCNISEPAGIPPTSMGPGAIALMLIP